MAAAENHQLIEQIKDVGNRLLQPPSSSPELLSLLDEVELLLSKIGQAPSQLVLETLSSTMKALIADELLKNSDADVMITVAACLNEVMRISAPVSPYDDEKMKEIFELIVSSFDKLSCPPGRCYSKAVLILESVARLRSCVMMLDLDCDPLITKMFELFQKNISSNQPHSVFLAMEKIMSVMIKESDSVSPELLKVLLDSIRKENQNVSPASFELGTKVVEECSKKLKPCITETVKLMGCRLEDYAPILSSVCEIEPDAVKNLVDDSAKHPVSNEPTADERQPVKFVQCLEAIEPFKKRAGTDSGTAIKKGRKTNSRNPDEGCENLTSSKGKTSRGTLRGRLNKSSSAFKSEEKATPGMKDKGETEEATHRDKKQVHQATPLGDSSDKKRKPSKKDISGGSEKKSATGASKKFKIQTNDASRSQRNEASSDDDVIETPHGRKSYKEDLIGSRIKVWWPLDRRYYEGIISSYDASTKKHKVDYDDGDTEVLNLRKERWEFVGDEISLDIEDLLAEKKTPQPPVNMPKQEATTEGKNEISKTPIDENGVMPDSEAEAGDGNHQATNIVEESKMSEDMSETKRPRLSDEQKS